MTYSGRPGDVYLICSDGLTTMIKEDRVREILTESASLDEATERLIAEANEAGGRDNITVVAFRLEQGDGGGGRRARRDPRRPDRRRRPGSQRRARARRGAQRGRASLGGAASGPAARREPPAAPLAHRAEGPGRRWSILAGLGVAAVLRRAPGLLPRHRRGRAPRALPRPAVRPAARASRSTTRCSRRRPGSSRCPRTAATRRPTTSCARATTPSTCSTTSSARRGTAAAAAAERRSSRPRRQGRSASGNGGGGSGAVAGRRRMSARNRELFALIPVALLVTAGFAAVFAVRSDEISDAQPDLRRLLPRDLPRHPHLPAGRAAERRPVPVPALRRARRGRPRRALPDRRDPRGRAGDGLPAGARRVRGDDRLPARLPRARALPLPDRRRLARAAPGARGCRASARR